MSNDGMQQCLTLHLSVVSFENGRHACNHSQPTLMQCWDMCSVTTQEVVEAIESQTGRTLDKKNVDLPDIKKLGTYDVSVRLHPNVVGKFKVVVQKQKEQR